MDLSKLSDADLEALSAGDMSKVSDEGLMHIASQPSAQPQGLMQKFFPENQAVVNYIDKQRKGQALSADDIDKYNMAMQKGTKDTQGAAMGSLGMQNVTPGMVSPGPIDKISNWLSGKFMSKATGVEPELGAKLAEQGVWGTRGGMLKQIEQLKPQAEGKIADVVKGIQGNIPTEPISQAVTDVGKKYQFSGGGSLPGFGQEVGTLEGLSKEVAQRGPEVAPQVANELRQGGWKLGFKPSGDMAPGIYGEAGRAIGNASREGLLKQWAKENPEAAVNALEDALKGSEALYKGAQGLKEGGLANVKLSDILGFNLKGVASKLTQQPLVHSSAAAAVRSAPKVAGPAALRVTQKLKEE